MSGPSIQKEQESNSWFALPTIVSPNIEGYLCSAGSGDELYQNLMSLCQWKREFPTVKLSLLQEMGFQSEFSRSPHPTKGHLKFIVLNESNYLLFDRAFDQDLVLIAREENSNEGSLMVISEIRITGIKSAVGTDIAIVQESLSFSSPFGPLFWKKQYLE